MLKINRVLTFAIASILLHPSAVALEPNTTSANVSNNLKLANVWVTSQRSPATGNIYYFTMFLPERTGKRFTRLSFSFTEQSRDKAVAVIPFDLSSARALVGKPGAFGREIRLKGAWIDETGTLWVEFGQPIPSNTTLTVALRVQQTNSKESYEYGVAAYPDSEKPVPIFVGNGILTTNP